MSEVVVLDTNVLLADPNSILSFPHAEVVIPETVLGELDKLKTARVDPDLRFRGREVSRLFFELSEEGSLVGGVDLAEGDDFESPRAVRHGRFASRRTQRAQLRRPNSGHSRVCRASGENCNVRLVTNDLNMLLKAQTLGVTVTRMVRASRAALLGAT